MDTISDQGWFVEAISSLAAGDDETLSACIEQYQFVHHDRFGEALFTMIMSLDEAGAGSTGADGWMTMAHPHLGVLQWDIGADLVDLAIRLNGHEILNGAVSEFAPNTVKVHWCAPAAAQVDPAVRRKIESLLVW